MVVIGLTEPIRICVSGITHRFGVQVQPSKATVLVAVCVNVVLMLLHEGCVASTINVGVRDTILKCSLFVQIGAVVDQRAGTSACAVVQSGAVIRGADIFADNEQFTAIERDDVDQER